HDNKHRTINGIVARRETCTESQVRLSWHSLFPLLRWRQQRRLHSSRPHKCELRISLFQWLLRRAAERFHEHPRAGRRGHKSHSGEMKPASILALLLLVGLGGCIFWSYKPVWQFNHLEQNARKV